MKGTIFLKPLEFNIEAIGEKWNQGDKLKGSLKIRNHGNEEVTFPFLKAAISAGHYKKIKAKDKKAWSVLDIHTLAENLPLSPGKEAEFSFEFKLKEDCAVTDKNGSLYLAFFDKDDPTPAGHIELVIGPKPNIKSILQIFENFLRFKVKEIKSVKGAVEVKLTPPSSRELSNLDGLLLTMSEVDKTMKLSYLFNVRAIDLASATMQVEKKTKEIEQIFTAKEYLMYGDAINQDFIIQKGQAALDMVKAKTL